MPIIKSAKKRVRVSAKAGARNSKTKRSLREALKAFYDAIPSGKTDKITSAHKQATSAIDTAAKKNIIHKNKAARKKQQLSAALKKSNVKLAAGKKVAKPATVKKTVAKKPVAKKVTAKAVKTTVKKSATKKPAVAKKTTKK
jgi:small subunit ribosomal protein S20